MSCDSRLSQYNTHVGQTALFELFCRVVHQTHDLACLRVAEDVQRRLEMHCGCTGGQGCLEGDFMVKVHGDLVDGERLALCVGGSRGGDARDLIMVRLGPGRDGRDVQQLSGCVSARALVARLGHDCSVEKWDLARTELLDPARLCKLVLVHCILGEGVLNLRHGPLGLEQIKHDGDMLPLQIGQRDARRDVERCRVVCGRVELLLADGGGHVGVCCVMNSASRSQDDR